LFKKINNKQKGSLPQMLVNKVLQKNPLIVDGIRKIAEKLDQSQFIGRLEILIYIYQKK